MKAGADQLFCRARVGGFCIRLVHGGAEPCDGFLAPGRSYEETVYQSNNEQSQSHTFAEV
jgi:hypothetical protein